MFYKIGVFENFCEIHRKTPVLELLFNKVVHMLSYDFCEIFKNTYFPITPENQKTFLSKNKLVK